MSDNMLRNVFIGLVVAVCFIYFFQGYIHYQLSSAVDCSLITTPSIYAPKDSNIGLEFPGQTLTIQQSRDLCFDTNMIHKFELCYYVNCGTDVNQTVNYESQPIKHSLADPSKTHLYPKDGEKFTIFDVYMYDVMIGGLVIIPLLAVGFMLYVFRDPKPDYKPHGTLPKDWGK